MLTFQPGEELVRAGARSGTISTTAATKVPGVSEANIRGTGGSSSGRLQVPDVRGRLPEVGVRLDPDSGPLELDPQVRRDISEALTPERVQRAQAAGDGSAVRGTLQGAQLSAEAALTNTRRRLQNLEAPRPSRPSVSGTDVRGTVRGALRGGQLSAEAAVTNARRQLLNRNAADVASGVSTGNLAERARGVYLGSRLSAEAAVANVVRRSNELTVSDVEFGADGRLRDLTVEIRSPNSPPRDFDGEVIDARAFEGDPIETDTDIPTANDDDLPDVDLDAVDGSDGGTSGPTPSSADARDVDGPTTAQVAETRLVTERRASVDLDDGPSVRTPIEPELTLEATGGLDVDKLGGRLLGTGPNEAADDRLADATEPEMLEEPDTADRLAAETVLREAPIELPGETQAPGEVTFEAERTDVSQELQQEPVERPSEPANPEPFGREPSAVESGPELPDEEESLTEFEALFDEEQFDTGFATGEELEDLL